MPRGLQPIAQFVSFRRTACCRGKLRALRIATRQPTRPLVPRDDTFTLLRYSERRDVRRASQSYSDSSPARYRDCCRAGLGLGLYRGSGPQRSCHSELHSDTGVRSSGADSRRDYGAPRGERRGDAGRDNGWPDNFHWGAGGRRNDRHHGTHGASLARLPERRRAVACMVAIQRRLSVSVALTPGRIGRRSPSGAGDTSPGRRGGCQGSGDRRSAAPARRALRGNGHH
jgi:hypothetical protein